MGIWNDIKNLKMPDFNGVSMPDSGGGSDTTSILIFIGVALLAFMLFRKLIKMAMLVGFIFLIIYFVS